MQGVKTKKKSSALSLCACVPMSLALLCAFVPLCLCPSVPMIPLDFMRLGIYLHDVPQSDPP